MKQPTKKTTITKEFDYVLEPEDVDRAVAITQTWVLTQQLLTLQQHGKRWNHGRGQNYSGR